MHRLEEAGRPALTAALKGAVDEVLSSAQFTRAPVMSRLLAYLADATVANDGDRLKAYTIAIEALGRSEGFDAQQDSYVRVQMVRLRKALAQYYAGNTPGNGGALYLNPGSYRLRLGRPEVAYPDIFRPAAPAPVPPSVVANPAPERRAEPKRRIAVPLGIAALAVAIALVAVAALVRTFERGDVRAAARVPLSPIAELSFATTGGDGDGVRALIADGLRRSWVVRLRTGPGTATAEKPTYAIRLRHDDDRLDVELVDLSNGTLMWSRTVALPAELDDAVAPVIARIGGATGLIATAEAAKLRGTDAPGYACMLKYLEFGQTRDSALQKRLDACLDQPSPELRMTAPLLAAHSFFTLEAMRFEPPDPAEIGRRAGTAAYLAQQAVEADPESAEAHYAVARIAYARNDCTGGNRATERAMASNPYQPMITAVLSGLSYPCGYPPARAMLDRAVAIQDEGDQYLRGYLLFAAIGQGRLDVVATLGLPERPPPGPLLTRYLLLEAIVAAAQDRRADAAAAWREFKANYAGTRARDEETLRYIVLSPRSRARVLELFRAKGVIKPQG